jgi:hypothetical protein
LAGGRAFLARLALLALAMVRDTSVDGADSKLPTNEAAGAGGKARNHQQDT